MPNEKNESLSEVWNSRFDDRDDEDLAWHVWAQRLAARERAMAEPIRNFSMPADPGDRPGSNDDKATPSAE